MQLFQFSCLYQLKVIHWYLCFCAEVSPSFLYLFSEISWAIPGINNSVNLCEIITVTLFKMMRSNHQACCEFPTLSQSETFSSCGTSTMNYFIHKVSVVSMFCFKVFQRSTTNQLFIKNHYFPKLWHIIKYTPTQLF